MGFKNYIIASLLLIVAFAAYVYSLSVGTYTLSIPILAINQEMPVYIWIIIPALILFLSTLFHMFYYGSKSFFVKRASAKDMKNIADIIKNRLSNEKSTKNLKTDELKELGKVLNQLEINIPQDGNFECNCPEITDMVAQVKDLNSEKFISAKKLKLDAKNPLMIQNTINRVKCDGNFALEVLKQPRRYDEAIVEIAFYDVLEKKAIGVMKNVLEYLTLSNKMAIDLLKKDSKSPKDQSFTNTEILEYIQNNKFTNTDLIEIARSYKRTMTPDQIIQLFEDISAGDESLTESYLYVLSEFEMITKVREIILNSQKDEYIVYKALIDLKDAGKKYTIDSLIK